ncbi:MAG: hypothetical protein ABIG95_01290 [Candidatus Woesearchaeota archaeon]
MKVTETESLNIGGKVLLFAAVGIVIAIAYYINGQYLADVYVNWDLINSLLLWLIFVMLVITMNKEHIGEIRYLRKISEEELREIKLLRAALSKK